MQLPFQTDRLILRPWRDEDLADFAAMNADPCVMRYFPTTLSRQESEALLTRIRDELLAEGFGLYAVERIEDGRLLGMTGLHRVSFEGPLLGEVEISWRFRAEAWGNGYATEAAKASLQLAKELGIGSIVSFTAVANEPSQRVMQRIGMEYITEFDHPNLPEGDPLRRHLLYRINL